MRRRMTICSSWGCAYNVHYSPPCLYLAGAGSGADIDLESGRPRRSEGVSSLPPFHGGRAGDGGMTLELNKVMKRVESWRMRRPALSRRRASCWTKPRVAARARRPSGRIKGLAASFDVAIRRMSRSTRRSPHPRCRNALPSSARMAGHFARRHSAAMYYSSTRPASPIVTAAESSRSLLPRQTCVTCPTICMRAACSCRATCSTCGATLPSWPVWPRPPQPSALHAAYGFDRWHAVALGIGGFAEEQRKKKIEDMCALDQLKALGAAIGGFITGRATPMSCDCLVSAPGQTPSRTALDDERFGDWPTEACSSFLRG